MEFFGIQSERPYYLQRGSQKDEKNGAMIIDISCDAHGGIETSEATTIDHPTYEVEGILHYVVDHTPSLFYKTASPGNFQKKLGSIWMICVKERKIQF